MRVLTFAAAAALLSIFCAACGQKTEHYSTTLEIARTQTIQSGGGKVIDVELEYSDCPGEQRDVFQEDAQFAECLGKYKLGEKVPAELTWQQLPDGHYDSEVDKVGDCVRHRDAADERSYEVVRECKDIVVNGVVVGFQCVRKPTPELLAKCPWFRRK
jgi:hypothetical protein